MQIKNKNRVTSTIHAQGAGPFWEKAPGKKAQGAIEYLLIIGGAILIVALVMVAMTGGVGWGKGINNSVRADENNDFNSLRIAGRLVTPVPNVDPTNLTAISNFSKTVDLSWVGVGTAVNYNVYRTNSSGTGAVLIGTSTPTTFQVTGLTNGTTYYYRVSANSPSPINESGLSNIASGTPVKQTLVLDLTLNPPSPVFLGTSTVLTAASHTTALPTQQPGCPAGVTCRLYRDGTALAAGTTTDTYTFSWGNHKYDYNTPGNTDYTSSTTTLNIQVTTTPPAAPVISATSIVGHPEIDVTWAPVTGATDYNIYRGNSTGTEVQIAAGVTTAYYNDTTVTPGQTHYYEVKSHNVAGYSDYSPEAYATAAKITPVLSFTYSPSNSVYYPTSTTIRGYDVTTGANCPPRLTCTLKRNTITVGNPDTQTLGEGTYNYIFSSPNTSEYNAASASTPLTVLPALPFNYLLNASTVTVNQGSTVKQTVRITKINGLSAGAVTISTPLLPSGITVIGNTGPCTPTSGSCDINLTYSAQSSTAINSYNFQIIGTSSGIPDVTMTTTLNVAAGAFNYTLSAPDFNMYPSSRAWQTVTVNLTQGLAQQVTVTASGLPGTIFPTSGFCTPTSGSCTIQLIYDANPSAALGSTTFTLTGASSGMANKYIYPKVTVLTVPLSYTLIAPDVSFSTTPQIVLQTITVTLTSGPPTSIGLYTFVTSLPGSVTQTGGSNSCTPWYHNGATTCTFTIQYTRDGWNSGNFPMTMATYYNYGGIVVIANKNFQMNLMAIG